mmetsp:Transcript_10511/g.12935  ORF Transcript_10511/g.12935 Transcript_10511/m.12935 type:complete len:234 (+) Transcript_10511:110-811(+)|eukprot:CAMPEP_0172505982 /NCGR_PEP_ID=MMETSP1066-20121228/190851_1 /TAXON_ID=671091 /ORGANISM="Coscinodiscus wailesii, Strain CCMP2513" /LENGTH=233 /DNA_ID=CAMNT_0013282803 /DNA_START=110 /DNA_END=811 /DNA_ORIENTATION=-
MGGIFSSACGGSEKQKKTQQNTISSVDRAVLDLKNARDKLNRYKKKLDNDQQKLLDRARAYNAANKKSDAIQVLKLRKHKLREAENVDNQLLTVLEMVDTIVSKEKEKDLLAAMSAGKDALEDLHNEMSVDDILNLMDEIQAGAEKEKEINDILSRGATLTEEDEDEIQKELEELEREMAKDAAPAATPTTPTAKEEFPVMPEAPKGDLPEIVSPETEEQEKEETANPVMVAS